MTKPHIKSCRLCLSNSACIQPLPVVDTSKILILSHFTIISLQSFWLWTYINGNKPLFVVATHRNRTYFQKLMRLSKIPTLPPAESIFPNIPTLNKIKYRPWICTMDGQPHYLLSYTSYFFSKSCPYPSVYYYPRFLNTGVLYLKFSDFTFATPIEKSIPPSVFTSLSQQSRYYLTICLLTITFIPSTLGCDGLTSKVVIPTSLGVRPLGIS